MIELEDALARLLAGIVPLGSETIPLRQAAGRFIAASVLAPIPLPPFDNSMFDGYAVRSADVGHACSERPACLKVIGEIPAGNAWSGGINAGEAVRIFTGAPLPTGADAIVMQEDTTLDPLDAGTVRILEASKPWEGVRFAGEDVKAGSEIAKAGDKLTAARLGLLAALGLGDIAVSWKPIVGIFSTGDELVTAGSPLKPGQIFENNRACLIPLLEAVGATVRDFGIIRDGLESTAAALRGAFAECDVVVTSGGVSVGDHDYVKPALELAGGHLDLWRVAIKPGKPFAFGTLDGKCLFGLPGNPISAMVTCLLLVRPALLKMEGSPATSPKSVRAELAAALDNDGNRRHYVRVRFTESRTVEECGLQASHALGGFALSDGLVAVPPGTRIKAGEAVEVLLWE